MLWSDVESVSLLLMTCPTEVQLQLGSEVKSHVFPHAYPNGWYCRESLQSTTVLPAGNTLKRATLLCTGPGHSSVPVGQSMD